MPSPIEIKTLNDMWTKLANFLGYRSQPNLSTLLVSETTENLTLFVDAAGSDSNPGTQDRPFLTIQAALDSLPKIVRHQVNINVGVGNFSAFAISGFTLNRVASAAAAGNGAWISVNGTLVNATVTTGTATGTVSAFSAATNAAVFAIVTDSTQTWTVNEHQGKMIEILTGTGAGQIFVITSNTSTAVTVAGFMSTVGIGATYAIRDWGTVINTCLFGEGSFTAGNLTGTGNTTAITMGGGARLQYPSAGTLTGTTEVLLDGASVTIASMRAASPKLLTNTYGTIIYE